MKKFVYIVLPFFGHTSVQMKINLYKVIGEYFPQFDPQIIPVNKFQTCCFFQLQRLSTECSQFEFSWYVLLR